MSVLERIREGVEARTGLTVQPRAVVDRLQETAEHYRQFRDEASEMAYWALDYFGGRPQELDLEHRKQLAQKSRVAFMRDPLAGAETQLLANFAFGRGITRPTAEDDAVQDVIDEGWTDANNEAKIFSMLALHRLSNTLRTQGELFITAYAAGGRVRFSWLDADTVRDIVPDPEDRLRPLYYVGERRTFRWDVERDAPALNQELDEQGRVKVTYYRHWRNVEDAENERKLRDGLEPLPKIPEEKLDPADARVLHVPINQLAEQMRGTPPWARTLRFYSAMNQFTESRVAMAQAQAQFIAKRVLKGTGKDIVKAAGSILAQTGELGTAKYGASHPEQPWGTQDPRGMPAPPGSWFVENEQHKLESLQLNSGAAQAAQDVQIIRAPIAAAGQFFQHYLGDSSNANLATASTLELPTQMNVNAWQEIFEGILRWCTDRIIEEAVRSGRLGGAVRDDEDDPRPIGELRMQEAEDIRSMEKRTKKKLSYTLGMPYPGRRNLPDVVNSFTGVMNVGGLFENEPMLEIGLRFLLTHGFELDDPAAATEAVMKAQKVLFEQRREAAMAQAGVGPDGQPVARNEPIDDQRSTYGEKRRTVDGDDPRAFEEEWIPEEARAAVELFAAGSEKLFRTSVLDIAAAVSKQIGQPSENGARTAA